MAELADALDLGSSGETLEGSSPSFRMTKELMKAELVDISVCKKSFDIEVPQDVVDHEISHIAQRNNQSFEEMKSRLTKEDALDNIKDNLKNRKALDIVVTHAKITTETVARTVGDVAGDAPEELTESAAEQG